jgi:hypothetical protein
MQTPETNPRHHAAFLIEQDRISSAAERSAFAFFYGLTQKEGIDAQPAYTWDQFDNGIAPFNGVPIELFDDTIEQMGIIPNYSAKTVSQMDEYVTPMTEALMGPFIRSLHAARVTTGARVIGNHPSLPSPLLLARAIAAAYQATYNEDIRSDLYSVFGAYPTVMNYSLGSGESAIKLSPVDIGRTLCNVVLTAPRTDSTKTDDPAANDWMNKTRAQFKICNRDISTPGKIALVHPSGRRAYRRSDGVVVEYLPDGGLEYITDVVVPTFCVGIDDALLINPQSAFSTVSLLGDPRPRRLTKDKQVRAAMAHCAVLATSADTDYRLETLRDQAMRTGRRILGRE